MTQEASIKKFWERFGLTAYPSTAVPNDVVFPYLVYENVYPDAYETTTGSVNIYYHTSSESKPNEKAREIRKALGQGGVQIPFDDGVIWLTLGSPAQINLTNVNDNAVKQRQLLVNYSLHTKE